MIDVSNLTVGLDATLIDVLTVLDASGQGVVFVIDKDRIVAGLLTDGDVRRALLDGAQVSDPVKIHMNSKFIYGRTPKNKADNIALLSEEISKLPILDEKGRVVDILRLADLIRLPIMEPDLKGREIEYVLDCLATNWISSQGKYVRLFEDMYKDYLPVNHALSVTNGTAALHLAMAALGIKSGDEVIVPDLTFAAPASMVLLCGAKPVFVDVDRTSWTIDPQCIEEKINQRTKAIVAVHLYGHPCDMDPIMRIAKNHNLFVIEDCAEALGAEYKGKKVGSIGDAGAFSFFANKVITTGEGGMVTTQSNRLHQKMKILRDHGMTKKMRYWHQYPGFNYRLTNLQAAIGVAQMEKIVDILDYRKKIVARYAEKLKKTEGIILPTSQPWANNIYWLYTIIIDSDILTIKRTELMRQLNSYGIDTRPMFHPLHHQPPYCDGKQACFPNAEWLSANGLSLPTSNKIKMEDVDTVCSVIHSITKNNRHADHYDDCCVMP